MEPMIDATAWPKPPGGWPLWVFNAPNVAAAHPMQWPHRPLDQGANCQRYAYGVLAMFGIEVPAHRSSELWEDPDLGHPEVGFAADLDLALFSSDASSAWGAHVAIVLGGRLLHLSDEVGKPTVWGWGDFAERARYRHLIGLVRCQRTGPDRSS